MVVLGAGARARAELRPASRPRSARPRPSARRRSPEPGAAGGSVDRPPAILDGDLDGGVDTVDASGTTSRIARFATIAVVLLTSRLAMAAPDPMRPAGRRSRGRSRSARPSATPASAAVVLFFVGLLTPLHRVPSPRVVVALLLVGCLALPPASCSATGCGPPSDTSGRTRRPRHADGRPSGRRAGRRTAAGPVRTGIRAHARRGALPTPRLRSAPPMLPNPRRCRGPSPSRPPPGGASCWTSPPPPSPLNGFHATSMSDVADAAGITKPVLYQHFAPSGPSTSRSSTTSAAGWARHREGHGRRAVTPPAQVERGLAAFFGFVAVRSRPRSRCCSGAAPGATRSSPLRRRRSRGRSPPPSPRCWRCPTGRAGAPAAGLRHRRPGRRDQPALDRRRPSARCRRAGRLVAQVAWAGLRSLDGHPGGGEGTRPAGPWP